MPFRVKFPFYFLWLLLSLLFCSSFVSDSSNFVTQGYTQGMMLIFGWFDLILLSSLSDHAQIAWFCVNVMSNTTTCCCHIHFVTYLSIDTFEGFFQCFLSLSSLKTIKLTFMHHLHQKSYLTANLILSISLEDPFVKS